MTERTTRQKIMLGIQHTLAMFGATVLVPALTGLNTSITLFCAGLGTLLFHLVTKKKVPVFLGSSFAFMGGVIAIIGIFMLLFQAFGNLRETLIVMINLPLALIGGVYAVFISGAELSIPGLIGFITLFGIATRNGIILVSHYNQLRKDGLSIRDTVIQGSLDRLSPVLMTASTAALALIPLLIGEPTGKEIERPLAIVVIGGLFTSTFLNLILVPTIYNKVENWAESKRKKETA